MPRTGHFILHSSVVPQVTAGRYELVTNQTVHRGNPADPAFEIEPQRTHVHVSSPRYTMPTDQILSSFPPANAEGAFGDRLPQIVLKRRTLPWERKPEPAAPPPAPEPPVRPWLALVVVAEGEAQLSTAAPVADCVTPGVPLHDPADKDVEQGLYLAVTETVVKKIFPTKDELELLVHVREVDVNDTELANGDDDGWLAVVLANRLPVFDKANGKPVRYMACLVNVEGQLSALPLPVPPIPTFEFALAQDWRGLALLDSAGGPDTRVTGNPAGFDVAAAGALGAQPRAGTAKRRSTAAVAGASLDGAAGMKVPPAAAQWAQATDKVSAAAADPAASVLVREVMGLGFRLPIERYAREKTLRFPVLAHWSFTTTEGATFETLMRDLDVGLLGTVAEPPANSPAADRPEVVQTGHIGLGHRTRAGDSVRAWYRAPCVPFPTPRDGTSKNEPLVLAHSADQLRRVIPDGREDLSLASAFEIGRLLALSQLSVVSALLRFRGEQFGAGRVREVLAEFLGFELPQLVADRVDMGRFAALRMMDDLALKTETRVGPRRPVADPGRALNVSGNLEELVARGLGFDLAGLKRRATAVGTLQALEELATPVALGAGKAPDTGVVVPALRSALREEVAHTLRIAQPSMFGGVIPVRRGAPRSGAAATAPATAGPDALDLLIAAAREEDAEESQ